MIKKSDFARNFWMDLMGALWGDIYCTTTHGVMSTALIAQHMGISADEAAEYLHACMHCGLTERQGGGWVV